MFMTGKMLAVVLVAVSFTTQSVLCEDYYRDVQDYYDIYERSSTPKEEHNDEAPSKESLELKMPGVRPEKKDSYFCTALDLRQENGSVYIVGFSPKAEMKIAHHMLMFGCAYPAKMNFARENKFWNCGGMVEGVCGKQGGNEIILYAWGRNAPTLKLPKDVAFEVGRNSGINYLVLQVHYGKIDSFEADPELKDYSGVKLNTTPQRQKYLAGIKILADGWSLIPPHKPAWHLDRACLYQNGPVLHPFAFRVHAHKLGRVIAGYRIRNDKWTLIGKGDPQRPQAFYNVNATEDLDIHPGDALAARCTYNSMERDEITYIGATMADEMCNFYMMYYYNPEENMGRAEVSTEESCPMLDESRLQFPFDSDVPLPDDGTKMEMKRSIDEEQCEPPGCRRKRSPSSQVLSPLEQCVPPSCRRKRSPSSQVLSSLEQCEPPGCRRKRSLSSQVLSSLYRCPPVCRCPPICGRRKRSLSSQLVEDRDWVGNKIFQFDVGKTSRGGLGQVTAVDLDSEGNIVVFHRASRQWTSQSFDRNNVFTNQNDAIPEPTVLKLDPNSGTVIDKWGEKMFFMPHGLTIDHEGNTWLTDVAMHQVFKFPPGVKEPTLTLGEKFEPGSDDSHFCKPTDVAVESTGTFYVSDGYCNSRIAVFSPTGSKIRQIDNSNLQGIVPGFFVIPHSLSLDKKKQRLYVADRENDRVVVFHSKSGERLGVFDKFGGPVYAVHYHSGADGGVLHLVSGPREYSRPQGFTFSLDSETVVQRWAPETGFYEPHDVTSDTKGVSVYVTDIKANTIWKFKENTN